MQFGNKATEMHKEQFKIPETQPEKKPDAMVNPAAIETPIRPLDVEKQYKELQEKRRLAKEAKTLDEARKHFAAPASADGKDTGGAIAQADSIDQKAVTKELTQVAATVDSAVKELEAAKTKPKEAQETARQKLQALQERQRQVTSIA